MITAASRFTPETMDEIDELVENGVFRNVSDAINQTVTIGLQIRKYQEMMQDPTQAAQFQKQMKSLIKNEQLDEWVQTLGGDQLNGIIMLLKTEKEARFKQSRFV